MLKTNHLLSEVPSLLCEKGTLGLQTILKRDNEELTKKIYNAQKANPIKGDWILMVKKDFKEIGLIFNEEEIIKESKFQFKERIKKSLRAHMFSKLKVEQNEHSKISHICYSSFKMQEYLGTHRMNNHEVSLLFSLRSRTAKIFRANFPFNIERMCPDCKKEEDTQEHMLKCEVMYPRSIRNNSISYNDIFSEDVSRQAAVIQLYANLIERREDASASTLAPVSAQDLQGNDSS